MKHFVVTYDRRTGHSGVTWFDDALQAFDEFARRERELMGDADIEIVMLSAEREEDLHASHPNFFAPGDLLPA